jgi:type IV pilus assembly protein PilB
MIKTDKICNNIENMFSDGGYMLNEYSDYKYIDLEKVKFTPEVLNLVPKDVAVRYCLMPFSFNEVELCVAMKDPDNVEAIGCLKIICKKQVIPYSSNVHSIYSMIEKHYKGSNIDKAVKDLLKRYNDSPVNDSNSLKRERESENAPAAQITEHLINKAILKKSSDIHIEPYSEIVIIRFRIDGVLFKEIDIPLDTYSAVSTRLKIMCGMDISEKRCPQDGKIEYRFGDREYDLRISSLPTIYGEKFVIRILYKSSMCCNLEGINFRENEYLLLKKMIRANYGMILVTGPTGSGKSTTLYSMLNELNNSERNITTIEDPVEYRMDGINQVNVNLKAKITFAAGLRSILRQDPDVIMIGEIRDEETASIAVRAAITGHLVISTLHTNDAVGAIPRLLEMGVERYLLSDCLIGVIAQRLVRKICLNCLEEYSPSELEMKVIKVDGDRKLYRGRGCEKCNNSGYSERCAVCEVLQINSIQRELILSDASTEKIRNYSSKIMRTLKEDCRELVLKGITTYEEFLKLNSNEF